MGISAILHASSMEHQRRHVAWMAEGLGRHGVKCRKMPINTPADATFCVIWGWKQQDVIANAKAKGMPILVMERGHLQPRMHFTSMGWNGLAGRAIYAKPEDCGDRWAKHWGHMEPWRQDGDYALIMGQTPGDASIRNVDFREWHEKTAHRLEKQGYEVRFRPHPNTGETRPLEKDLAGASLVVTWNSTSGVEAALAGVPVVACDEGAMVWPVASHDVDEPVIRPDRQEWVEQLACCQWEPDEIVSGEFWEPLKAVMPLQ